jgi:hypothetical protein
MGRCGGGRPGPGAGAAGAVHRDLPGQRLRRRRRGGRRRPRCPWTSTAPTWSWWRTTPAIRTAARPSASGSTDVAIPKGAQILSAHLQFAVDEGDKNADPFDVTIWGEAADNPPAYANTPYNISSRDQDRRLGALARHPVLDPRRGGPARRPTSARRTWPPSCRRSSTATAGQEGNAMAFILKAGPAHRRVLRRRQRLGPGPGGDLHRRAEHAVELSGAPDLGRRRRPGHADERDLGPGARQRPGGPLRPLRPARGLPDGPGAYADDPGAAAHHAQYRGMNNHFAKLSGLLPDTAYRFVIADARASECMWFRTAPAVPQAFTYITGGDTKSSGDALQAGRWSNQMVAKLRPLFVLFTGDYNSGDGTDDASWQQWLTDWSEGTRPRRAHVPDHRRARQPRGRRLAVLYNLFDSGNNDPEQPATTATARWTFGGGLLHLINLNSQLYLNGKLTAAQPADRLARRGPGRAPDRHLQDRRLSQADPPAHLQQGRERPRAGLGGPVRHLRADHRQRERHPQPQVHLPAAALGRARQRHGLRPRRRQRRALRRRGQLGRDAAGQQRRQVLDPGQRVAEPDQVEPGLTRRRRRAGAARHPHRGHRPLRGRPAGQLCRTASAR